MLNLFLAVAHSKQLSPEGNTIYHHGATSLYESKTALVLRFLKENLRLTLSIKTWLKANNQRLEKEPKLRSFRPLHNIVCIKCIQL